MHSWVQPARSHFRNPTGCIDQVSVLRTFLPATIRQGCPSKANPSAVGMAIDICSIWIQAEHLSGLALAVSLLFFFLFLLLALLTGSSWTALSTCRWGASLDYTQHIHITLLILAESLLGPEQMACGCGPVIAVTTSSSAGLRGHE